jgi:hypothetical protein
MSLIRSSGQTKTSSERQRVRAIPDRVDADLEPSLHGLARGAKQFVRRHQEQALVVRIVAVRGVKRRPARSERAVAVELERAHHHLAIADHLRTALPVIRPHVCRACSHRRIVAERELSPLDQTAIRSEREQVMRPSLTTSVSTSGSDASRV